MGDAEVDIVTDRGERVEKLAVGADQNRVGHRGGVDRERAEDAVGPLDALVVEQEAPHAVAALGAQLVLLGVGKV